MTLYPLAGSQWEVVNKLILPGTPEFDFTLGTCVPPNWKEAAFSLFGEYTFVADSETGLLKIASFRDTDEYLYGGEYERRLEQISEDDEFDEYGFFGGLDTNWELYA